MKNTIIYLTMLLVLAYSCKPESEILSQESQGEVSKNIKIGLSNGMLTFNSRKDFFEAKNNFYDNPQIKAQIKNLSFVSMKDRFQEIIQAEDEYENEVIKRNLSENELNSIDRHSSLYYAFRDKGTLYEYKEEVNGVDEVHYDYNLHNPTYAPLVNDVGMVTINDTVYQFQHDFMKVIIDEPTIHAEELKRISSSTGNIQVFDLTKLVETRTNNFDLTRVSSQDRERRVVTSIKYIYTSLPYYNGFQVECVARVKGEKKNIWGSYKPNNTQDLTLYWEIDYILGGQSNQDSNTQISDGESEISRTVGPHGVWNLSDRPGVTGIRKMKATGTGHASRETSTIEYMQ